MRFICCVITLAWYVLALSCQVDFDPASVTNICPISSTQPPSASLLTPRVSCAKATVPGSRVSRARLPRACTRTTTCSSAQRPLPSLPTRRRSLRRRSCRSSLMLSRSSSLATCAISLSPVRRLAGSILMMVLWDWPERRVRFWVSGHSGRRLRELGSCERVCKMLK